MSSISTNQVREFDISEILAIAWNIFRTKYSVIFTIGFIVYLPANVLLAGMPEITLNSLIHTDYFTTLHYSAVIVCSMLLGFGGNIVVAVAVNNIIFNQNDSIADTLKIFFKKIINSFHVNLFVILLFFLGSTIWLSTIFINSFFFLAVTVPAIILLNYWVFGIYSFAVKDLNLFQSLKYSFNIVYGRWNRVFLYTVLLFLMSMIVVLIASVPYSFLGGDFAIEVTFNTLVSILSSFFVIAFTVFFINFEATFELSVQQVE